MTDVTVGARVNASGKTGVVMFVGEVDFNRGIWVGIELDDPLGKHDGIVKGKRYFKCKKKHGTMTKLTKVKVMEAKKKVKKSTTRGDKDSSKSRTKSPISQKKKKVELKDQGTQTEEEEVPEQPESAVDDMKLNRENLELLQEMKDMADARRERLTQEVTELQKQVRDLQAENEGFRNAKEEAESALHLVTMEKDNLEQELEFVQMDLEELQAKYEILELDINIMKEGEEHIKEEVIESLTGDTQELAIAIDERDRMEEALTQLKDAFESEIKKRDFKLVHLEKQAELVPQLEKDLKEAGHENSKLKQEIVQQKSDISELKSEVDMLSDSMDMVENLIEKNLVLEERKSGLEEEVTYLTESLEIQEELAVENDDYQNELIQQIEDVQEELSEKEIEVQDLQKALFQARGKMGQLEDNQTLLGKMQDEAIDNNQQSRVRVNELTKELLTVKNALDDCRQDIVDYEKLLVKEQQTQMTHALIMLHIPNSVQMDEMTLDFMTLLERCAGKASSLRVVCNRLYLDTVNPDHSPEEFRAARSIAEDALEIETALQIIITGVMGLTKDKFETVLVSWRQLLGLDEKLDFVLSQIEEKSLGTYSNEDMRESVKICQEFVQSHFAGQNPTKKRTEGKATKVHVNYNLGHALLHLLDMKHNYDKASTRIAEHSTANAKDAQWFTEAQQALDAEVLSRGVDEMGMEINKVKRLEVDTQVLMKMDRLLAQIIDRTKEVLSVCVLPLPDYGDREVSTKQLTDSRNCLVGFDMITPCLDRVTQISNKMMQFAENLTQIDGTLKFNDRVLQVNQLLHGHSRVHPDGIVSNMEELYYLVGNVLQGLRSVAAVRDDADMGKVEVQQSARCPAWVAKANVTRAEIEAATKVREDLEEAQQTIKEKNQDLFKSQQKERQAAGALSVLQKEISKLRTRNTKFAELERSHKVVLDKKERYKLEFSRQQEKTKDWQHKYREVMTKLTAAHEEVEKLRKAKPGASHRSARGDSDAELTREYTDQTGGAPKAEGEGGSSDVDRQYVRILERTVNQLRTQVNTMNFREKSSLLKRELRPLTQKKPASEAKTSSKKDPKKKDAKKVAEMTEQFEKQLHKLNSDLNFLWSTPSIVDISSKAKFFETSQSVLNRQTELNRIERRAGKVKGLIHKQAAEVVGLKQSSSSARTLVGKVEIPLSTYQIQTDVLVRGNELGKIYDVFVH